MKLLKFIRSLGKPAQPTIESYGQASSGLPLEQIQPVMEWLFFSLLNAGYFGRSHLIWDSGDQNLLKTTLTGLLKDEPASRLDQKSRSATEKSCHLALIQLSKAPLTLEPGM